MEWYHWLAIAAVIGVVVYLITKKPDPENCQGRWEDVVGSCDNKTGMIQQKYRVVSPNKNGGLICEAEDGASRLKQDVGCHVAIDCKGQWETVDGSCDNKTGLVQQKFKVVEQAYYGGKCEANNGDKRPKQDDSCKKSIDCVGQWEDVPNTCDRSTETVKQKYKVITPSQYGGTACPAENGSIRDSSSIECKKPVNCQASWELVKDSCDKSTGFMKQIYNVVTNGQYGGLPCETAHGTVRDYSSPQCKKAINCAAKWEDVAGSCDNQTGLIKQKYRIEIQDKDGGIACEAANASLRDAVSKDCKKSVDCQGKWNLDINSCDKKTGLMKQTYQITVPNEAGGKICDSKDGDVKYIETDTCIPDPIDCKADFTEVADSCAYGRRQFKVTNVVPNNKTGKTCLQVYKDKYPNLTTEPKVGMVVDKADTTCNPVNCSLSFESLGDASCSYSQQGYKVTSVNQLPSKGGKSCVDVYKNEFKYLQDNPNYDIAKVGANVYKTDTNCAPVDCQWHYEPLHCTGFGNQRWRKVKIDVPFSKGGKWCLRDPNDLTSSVYEGDLWGGTITDPTCP